jgi:hypothetical protein
MRSIPNTPFRTREGSARQRAADAADQADASQASRRTDLFRLADEVWEGGGKEIEHFLEIALSDQPFPL